MNDISNTALVTLKCHIQDATNKDAILNDESSLKVYDHLNTMLDDKGKIMLNKSVGNRLAKHTASRAKKYDDYARQFLKENPEAVIVNIGCGLDHRFERIDNGKCTFYDLDLPDLIDIKREIFPETERYRHIGKSVFDFSWMAGMPKQPVLLLAEGVFMFCYEKDVKSLFQQIHRKMPGTTMVFEVFNSKWLAGWRKKLVDFKLRRQLKFGKDATFQFGISDSDEIESWSEAYKLIEEWCYIDDIKPNAKEWMRKIQWTVTYKIN